MRELANDPFYNLIEEYNRCIIDYCLVSDDVAYQGYESHKAALAYAMRRVIERYVDNQAQEESACEQFPWSMEIEKAQAELIDSSTLLHVPDITEDKSLADDTDGGQIPYWYAFWNTPHGTGYGPQDFMRINDVLFPNGANSLEVYEWTTDWSNYFDDGHEWWGAACWSVYDKAMDRFVIIMASTTD